jgi:hypothetical protein
VPTTWNPAFAQAAADKLNSDHASETETVPKMLTARGLTLWAAAVDPTNAMAISEGIVQAVASIAPAHGKMLQDFSGGQAGLEGGGIDFSNPVAQGFLAQLIYDDSVDPATGVPHLTQAVVNSIISGTTKPKKIWEVEGLSKAPTPVDIRRAYVKAGTWTEGGA